MSHPPHSGIGRASSLSCEGEDSGYESGQNGDDRLHFGYNMVTKVAKVTKVANWRGIGRGQAFRLPPAYGRLLRGELDRPDELIA
jgi:hypothetical protein